MADKQKTIYQQMEEIAEEICDNYCRYTNSNEFNKCMTDDELDTFHDKYRDKCPLMKLY